MDQFDLLGWLHDEVGFEEPIHRRKNLFVKLHRLYMQYGTPLIAVVGEAWAQANEQAQRDKITHYFCRTVKLMLIERHMWHEERRFDGMELSEILATGVFKSRAKLPLFPEAPMVAQPPPPSDMRERLRQRFREQPTKPPNGAPQAK